MGIKEVLQETTTTGSQNGEQTDWFLIFFVMLAIVGVIAMVGLGLRRQFQKSRKREDTTWYDVVGREETFHAMMMDKGEDLLVRQIQGFIPYSPLASAAGLIAIWYLRSIAHMDIGIVLIGPAVLITAGGGLYVIVYLYRLEQMKSIGDWIVGTFWFLKNKAMTKHIRLQNDVEIASESWDNRMKYLKAKLPMLCERMRPTHAVLEKRDAFISRMELGDSDAYNYPAIQEEIGHKLESYEDKIKSLDKEGYIVSNPPRLIRAISRLDKDAEARYYQRTRESWQDQVHDLQNGMALMQRAEVVEKEAESWYDHCTTCKDKCRMFNVLRHLSIVKNFRIYEYDLEQMGEYKKIIGIFPGEYREAMGQQRLQIYVRKLARTTSGYVANFYVAEVVDTIQMQKHKKLGREIPVKVKTPIVYLMDSTFSREMMMEAMVEPGHLDRASLDNILKYRKTPRWMDLLEAVKDLLLEVLFLREQNLYDESKAAKRAIAYIKAYDETGEMPPVPRTKRDKLFFWLIIVSFLTFIAVVWLLPELGISLLGNGGNGT